MSQHTGSQRNSLNLLGEKYLSESHWPMRRIRLLECISSSGLIRIVTGDTSERQSFTRTMTRETGP